MPVPFYLGMRAGSVPLVGATLSAHAIADAEAQTSLCGAWTSLGWSQAAAGPALVADQTKVTCGFCLAALTRITNVPANAT